MALNIDDNGDVYIYQGDTGEIVVNGLPTNKDYTVYLTVKDIKRKTVGSELSINSNFKSFVKFVLSSAFTNLMTVPDDEDCAVYTYGIKLCDGEGTEDTLFVENTTFGEPNRVIVYPKKVEGV